MDNYITTYGMDGYFTLNNIDITSDTYVKFKVTPLEAPNGFWFGSFIERPYFAIFHPNNSWPDNTIRWYMGYSEAEFWNTASVDDIIGHTFEIECGYGILNVDGESISTPSFTVPFSINNFGIGTGMDTYYDGRRPLKWNYFQVYEGANLLYDLIPAYHNNTYCFYDNVSGSYIYPTGNVDGEVITFSATAQDPNFKSYGDSTYIDVVSENPWTATAPSWITLSTNSGSGDAQITASAGANETASRRTGVITFTDGTETAAVSLTQGNKSLIVQNLYQGDHQIPMAFRNGNMIYKGIRKS